MSTRQKILCGLLTIAAFIAQWSLLFIDDAYAKQSEITVLSGRSTENSLLDRHDRAYAIEYNIPYEKWTARLGYLNEGSLSFGNRDGLFVQSVIREHLTERLSGEAFIGPYLTSTTKDIGGGAYRDMYSVRLLAGAGLNLRIADTLSAAMRWQRVTTFHDNDSDVWMLGLSYTFKQ